MIQTILFATDLCVFTPYLLRHVSDLCQRWGAKAVLVHAVEPLGILGTAVVNTYLPAQIGREFNEHGLETLLVSIKERLIDLLADEMLSGEEGVAVIKDVQVTLGRPDDVILQTIADCSADLVVLGSHSPDRHGYAELGSVAMRVMQHSKIPVYLVPVSAQSPAMQDQHSRFADLR